MFRGPVPPLSTLDPICLSRPPLPSPYSSCIFRLSFVSLSLTSVLIGQILAEGSPAPYFPYRSADGCAWKEGSMFSKSWGKSTSHEILLQNLEFFRSQNFFFNFNRFFAESFELKEGEKYVSTYVHCKYDIIIYALSFELGGVILKAPGTYPFSVAGF